MLNERLHAMDNSPAPSTTRREFTGHTLQALLTVSLLEHLNAADLFAAKAKLTARQWLNKVNETGHAVKGNKLKGVAKTNGVSAGQSD